MSKSLQEIWEKMQQDLQMKRQLEDAKEKEIFERKEKLRQEYLERNRMYEALTSQPAAAASSAAGGGSKLYEEYISQTDTIWLYPQADLDAHIATYIVSGNTYTSAPGLSPSVTFTRNGNVFSFPTLSNSVNFFSGVYLVTETSQPIGNAGFSCGVGTRTRAKKQDRLILKLDSGIKVVEWALMEQLTSQSSLPVGGNSPDGTVGWSNIYCDWDLDGIQDPNSSAADALSNLIDGLVFKRIG
jgi:hypothetical protein